jgi:NAD(P)-dependent dehydrogenase (short-subunit alcohol dehydrogenase family)
LAQLVRNALILEAVHTVNIFGSTKRAASWTGVTKAPQYSASKHGVLGLMRAIDPIVTADNIRIAAIHPWFAGM